MIETAPSMMQDFAADFDSITAALRPEYSGPPISLARFGDGEYAILNRMVHKARSDGWKWGGGFHELIQPLFQSLTAGCEIDDYYVGISAANHHPRAHKWYCCQLEAYDVPPESVTFASLFAFANYSRFRSLDLGHCFTIGNSESADMTCPADPRSGDWRWFIQESAAELAMTCRRPIVVSAGPWASVLIYEYVKMMGGSSDRQAIIDVGSAFDRRLRRRTTRKYQLARHPMRRWVPRWSE